MRVFVLWPKNIFTYTSHKALSGKKKKEAQNFPKTLIKDAFKNNEHWNLNNKHKHCQRKPCLRNKATWRWKRGGRGHSSHPQVIFFPWLSLEVKGHFYTFCTSRYLLTPTLRLKIKPLLSRGGGSSAKNGSSKNSPGCHFSFLTLFYCVHRMLCL